jgi:ribosomal protein L2
MLLTRGYEIQGVRHSIAAHHPHLHKGKPLKELTLAKRRKGGRNNTGRVVNRFVGGGHKQRIRIVDFNRFDAGEHEVVRIEYDPGRSAHIALIRSKEVAKAEQQEEEAVAQTSANWWAPQQYKEDGRPWEHKKVFGGYSYILAPEGLREGDVVRSYRAGIPSELIGGLDESNSSTDPSSPQTVLPPGSGSATSSSRALGLLRTLTLKPGNVLPLYLCPPGTIVHNISLSPSGKMQLCRSAGAFGQVVSHGVGRKDIEGEEKANNAIKLERANIDRGWTLVKLQSGEVRKLHPSCVATVGTVSK